MSYSSILRNIFNPVKNTSKRIFACSTFATYRNPDRQLSEPQHSDTLFKNASKLFESDAFRDVRLSEKIWKYNKDNQSFKKFYQERFQQREYSPDYIVSLIRTACHVCMCSADLVITMLMALTDCVQKNNVSFEPTFEQQLAVLTYILGYRNNQLTQLLANLFKMNKNAMCFKQFVEDLISKKQFVEAAICIWILNLQKEFDVNQIAVPLLIEGKIQPVMYYVSNHPELQMSIANTLDDMLVMPGKSKEEPQSISPKIVFKTLSTLVNSFKLHPENFKNLCYIRGRAAINVLIRRRRGKMIAEETWEGMIMSIVKDHPDLKTHLIYKLVSGNDKETALKMLPKLDMGDFDVTTIASKVNLSKLDEFDDGSDEKISPEESTDHLTFDLTLDDIKFVDTVEKFIRCIDDISKNYKILGIDSEWKANFGLSQDRLSLIQLAVHDKVYILDLLSLNDCLRPEHWDKLLDNVLGNPNIIKLGCGIMSDVQMIVENNRGSKHRVTFTHILDMAVFYDKLEEVYPEKMGVKDPSNLSTKNTKGLSTLCELLLGKPLNKEVRLCDWEQRPLTESQLEYAALDAHCLLRMFDSLRQKSLEGDMNFDHLVKVAIYLTNQSWRPKKKFKGISSENILQVQKAVNIDKLKLLVDFSLREHGEKLKKLGADVVTLSHTATANNTLKRSKVENRIIICSETLHNQIKDKNANAFCVKDVLEGQSITSAVLAKYNVKVKSKNSFSRCEVCDSMDGIRMSSENITLMKKQSSINVVPTEGESTDNLQAILKALSESGISIRYSNEKDVLLSKGYAFLCMKCGTVQ